MILETERLVLREMTEEDYESLSLILQDREVMYAYEGPFTDQQTRDWLEEQFTRYRQYGFGLWAVVLKESGKMIGQCGLTMQNWSPTRRVLEVGYLFQKAHWHKGYAAEAAIACRDYAFQKLGAGEVFSIVRDTNLPSQKVARRNGMEIVAEGAKQSRGTTMLRYLFSVKRQDLME